MYKTELVAKVSRDTKVPPQMVSEVLEVTLDTIASNLKRGRKVIFKGFGAFVVRKKKKRTMHSVLTGGKVVIPAHRSVAFVPGRPLKDLVRGK